MAKSAELTWLDALEAEESGDREAALGAAKKTVRIDPTHSDGWMGVARWTLPPETRGRQDMPDLQQSAKAMAALRKVVEIDPENPDPSWITFEEEAELLEAELNIGNDEEGADQ